MNSFRISSHSDEGLLNILNNHLLAHDNSVTVVITYSHIAWINNGVFFVFASHQLHQILLDRWCDTMTDDPKSNGKNTYIIFMHTSYIYIWHNSGTDRAQASIDYIHTPPAHACISRERERDVLMGLGNGAETFLIINRWRYLYWQLEIDNKDSSWTLFGTWVLHVYYETRMVRYCIWKSRTATNTSQYYYHGNSILITEEELRGVLNTSQYNKTMRGSFLIGRCAASGIIWMH